MNDHVENIGARARPRSPAHSTPETVPRPPNPQPDRSRVSHGQTIAAPFSLRPLPGAPASCPLAWSEVTARLNPARFTMATVPKRFDKMPGPLVPVLTREIDMAAAGAHIEQRLCEERGDGAGSIRTSGKPGTDSVPG
jgi:hypothetical protein